MGMLATVPSYISGMGLLNLIPGAPIDEDRTGAHGIHSNTQRCKILREVTRIIEQRRFNRAVWHCSREGLKCRGRRK